MLICTFWSNKKQLAYGELTTKPKKMEAQYIMSLKSHSVSNVTLRESKLEACCKRK